MSRQRVRTEFAGYDRQIFHRLLDKINGVYNRVDVNGEFFKGVAESFRFGIERLPQTEDGYRWFWGLYSSKKSKELALLFPWAQDWKKYGCSRLDRSIALYVNESAFRKIDSFVEVIYRAFLIIEH